MKKIQLKNRTYILLLIIIMLPIMGFSQNIRLEAIADTTDLKGQFEYLFRKSSRYQEYKVIPISGYNFVKKNSLDSISKYRGEITSKQDEIISLSGQLAEKESKIKELNEELEVLHRETNYISLFGINLGKGTYITVMTILLLLAVGVCIIFYLLYKQGHQVVKSTKERLNEVQEEFETHRKNTLVREQKLARELMDVKLKSKRR